MAFLSLPRDLFHITSALCALAHLASYSNSSNFLAGIAVILIQEVGGIDVGFSLDYVMYSILVFGILWLGYNGIKHQNIFVDNDVYVPEKDADRRYKSQSVNSLAYANPTEAPRRSNVTATVTFRHHLRRLRGF